MNNKKTKHPLVKKNIYELVYRLTKNLVYLLLVFTILLFSIYIVGNFQNFLDKSQFLILSILSACSVFMVFLSFVGIIENVIMIFTNRNKGKCFLAIILLFITFIIGMIFIFYSTVIQEISLGVD